MLGRIKYLLDTDAVSSIVNQRRGPVATRIRQIGQAVVGTSVIVAAEVRFGYMRRGGTRLARDADEALSHLGVLAYETPADFRYAELRARLERAGTPIGPNNMLIAAHALALDLTLVTGNEREFRRVPGLRIENWLEPQALT